MSHKLFQVKSLHARKKTQLQTSLIQQIYSCNIQSIFYVKIDSKIDISKIDSWITLAIY